MSYLRFMSESKMNWIAFLLFIVVGFSIYGNSFDVPFIFDDSDNIQNPSLRINELSPDSLLKAAVDSNLLKRPVANVSFAINYYFGVYNVRGYHLVNILIHIAASFFLFLLLKITFELPVNREKYFNSRLIALLASLLWLTHPLATQSVTYLVQRMNSLAAMFYVLAVLCYVQGRLKVEGDNEKLKSFDGWLWFAGSLISGILAIGSKEIAVTLPTVIFLYEWFFFQDLSWKWLNKKIPWIIALLVFLYCAAYYYLGGNPLSKIFNSCNNRPFSSLERVLTEFRVVMHYIGLIIYPNPDRLVFDYNFPLSISLFSPISTVVSILSLALICVLAAVIAKKERFIAFCVFWFFINLILESSVICLEIIFEHRTYLPSMFLLAIIPALLVRTRLNTVLMTIVLLTLCAGCGYWTIKRNKTWQDLIGFWQDSINKQPMKARGYNNLGVALAEANRMGEAGENFLKALELLPDFPEAYSNLGLVQYRQNRLVEAEKNFKQALDLRSHYIEGRLNLASLYKDQGKYDEALEQYRALYRQIPDNSIINKEMGQTLLRMGRPEESLSYLEKALGKLPQDKNVLLARGEVFMRSGKLEEAIQSYQAVLNVDKENSAANYNLGLLFTATGQEEEALSHYLKVVQRQSVDMPVLYNIGNTYLRLGAMENARSAYEGFIDSSRILADAHNNLGLVFIQEGNLERASEEFKKALRIDPNHPMAAKNLEKVQQEVR